MQINMEQRIRIARGFLGPEATFDQPWGGFCRCPHGGLHGGGKAKGSPKECRVYLDRVPTIHCFHTSCAGLLEATNRELRSAIGRAEAGGTGEGRQKRRRAPMPKSPEPPRAERRVDSAACARLAALVGPEVGEEEWWVARSPVEPSSVSAEAFLDFVFRPGDRVMVTTAKKSTGDYLWVAGAPGRAFRLAKKQGVKATPAPRLPRAGRGGVMFGINPVDGLWHPTGAIDSATGMEKMGRRGKQAVVRFPHILLETDDLDGATWLRIVAQLPPMLMVVAVLHTGGRGYHVIARLRTEPVSLPEYEFIARQVEGVLSRVGADWQALGVTKSSRLPWAVRVPEDFDGEWSDLSAFPRHRLIFLNPWPEPFPITKLRVRDSITTSPTA